MLDREIGNMITKDEKGFFIAKNSKGAILKLNDKSLKKYFESGLRILIDGQPVGVYQDVVNIMFVKEQDIKILASANEFFKDF